MAVVTAALTDTDGLPLRRTFVEHVGPFGVSLGWRLTDENGSVTLDAGFGFSRVDVRVHCRNSVIRVVDDSDAVPGTSRVAAPMNLGNGEVAQVGAFGNHFRILTQSLDVYDTVWRQFRPFNNDGRRAFPLRRRPGVQATFEQSSTCEAVFPDQTPVAPLTYVEPVGLLNNSQPIVHIKPDPRLFGNATADRSLIPHELGHVFHFAASRATTRAHFETGYLAALAGAALTGGSVFHDFDQTTSPLVAYIEAAGIFSERFFFFAKLVEPTLTGVALRQAFFRDELAAVRSLPSVLVDDGPRAGRLAAGTITPSQTGPDVEGAVYGAIYLDFARRVGLREAVGLVLDSNALSFAQLQTYVQGRGNPEWTAAIDAVAATWAM
jgi:hypothetical protein